MTLCQHSQKKRSRGKLFSLALTLYLSNSIDTEFELLRNNLYYAEKTWGALQ